ncbi:MAG: hypothetical protein ABI592_15190 [Acidobacteriota bacterium]
MNNDENRPETVYGVWADHSTLNRESLGPLFGRITIAMRGPVDPRWTSAYMAIRREEAFARFTLDPKEPRVSFTFRSTEPTDAIQALIQRLDLLVELANLQATAAASGEKRRQTSA